MTPEELARAIRAEREGCARLCDAVATMDGEPGPKDFLRRELTRIVREVARELAAKIRARP